MLVRNVEWQYNRILVITGPVMHTHTCQRLHKCQRCNDHTLLCKPILIYTSTLGLFQWHSSCCSTSTKPLNSEANAALTLKRQKMNKRLIGVIWWVNSALNIHSFFFMMKPTDVPDLCGHGLSCNSSRTAASRHDPQWHHVWPREEQSEGHVAIFHPQSPSWGTATALFVLLGFRLFRCAGLLLLLGDWWELGQAVLICFALVELFGFLVKFVQVEFPDDVFLVMSDRRRQQKRNKSSARTPMCVQTNLSEAPGHSSTFLVHLRTTHHLFPSLEQHEWGKLFGQGRCGNLVPGRAEFSQRNSESYLWNHNGKKRLTFWTPLHIARCPLCQTWGRCSYTYKRQQVA